MWVKELWDSRWRAVIMNPIAWLIAVSFPLLFRVIEHPPKPVPPTVAALLHYPTMAFGWFGEDLPELLLVYIIIWCLAQITREWQTGSVEFLGQLPLTPGQVALRKGLFGTLELFVLSTLSTLVLWIASTLFGHALPVGAFLASWLLVTLAFVGVLWFISLWAWFLHSTYSVLIISLAFYVLCVVTRASTALHRFSPLTYMENLSPAPAWGVLWAHMAFVLAGSLLFAYAAVRVAARQEFVANRGRDQ